MLNTKQLFSFVLIAAAAWPVQNAVAQKIKPGTVAKVDTAVTKSVNKTINNTLKSTAKLSAAAKGVTPSAKHSVYPSQALSFVPSPMAPKATALNPRMPACYAQFGNCTHLRQGTGPLPRGTRRTAKYVRQNA